MAKLKAPLNSFEAHGSLGDIVSFKLKNRIAIAEKRPEVKDAKSAGQLSWRTMFEKCTLLWHSLSDAERQTWESLARVHHMTGYALWQSQCLRPNPGIYLPLAGGTMTGAIAMSGKAITGLLDPAAGQDAVTKAWYLANLPAGGYTQGAGVYSANANQTVLQNTWYKIQYELERWDTDTIHDNGINNTRLTCKTAGVYVIDSNAQMTVVNSGTVLFELYLNNNTIINHVLYNGGAASACGLLSTKWNMAVNDYVETRVFSTQATPGKIAINVCYSPEFRMARVG